MRGLLIIGCGGSARRALPWPARHYRVHAAVRSDARLDELRTPRVAPLRADPDPPRSLRRPAGIGNPILHFAPPRETGRIDDRTRTHIATLSAAKILPRRLVCSSTSGICAGERLPRAGVERRVPAAMPSFMGESRRLGNRRS